MIGELRKEVCAANIALHQNGLVAAHSGNASAIDRKRGIVIIKPSGIDVEQMTAENMVPIEVASGISRSSYKPSVDLPHHLYLYRHDPSISAVIHTHSNYATAFAACGKAIPPVLTAIADEFGGEIPCAPYVDNENDHIGRAILRHRTDAPGLLLAHHGVFTWGKTVKDALKAAIMIEDAAKTVWLALQIGSPEPLTKEEVSKWHDRYQNRYGQ